MKPGRYGSLKKRDLFWIALIVGFSIPIIVLLGVSYEVSQDLVICVAVIATLVFAAMLLWHHASANATGDEWWQDDDPAGWRGY